MPKKNKRPAHSSVLPRPVADVWSAGVGALTAVRKRGTEGFDALVARGQAVQDSGEQAAREAIDRVERAASSVTDRAADTVQSGVEAVVERVLGAMGMPGRDEVAALNRQVDALRARVVALGGPSPDGAAPEAAAYSVEPHPDGWAVRHAGVDRALSVHATKKEATVAARQVAKAHAPSRLVLHRADGTAGETVDYAPPDDL